MNLALVRYMIDNHVTILSYPVSGQLVDIYCLFVMYLEQWLKERTESPTFLEFVKDLEEVSEIGSGSITFAPGHEIPQIIGEEKSIDYINVETLKILYNFFKPGFYISEEKPMVEDTQVASFSQRFFDVLEESTDITPNNKVLSKLESLLKIKPSFFGLSQERASLTTPNSSYIPVCHNKNHSSILSSIAHISANSVVSLKWNKHHLQEGECPGLEKCVLANIHYIPNLKPQTDLALGDCSYLDTCHKLNSCRYVHYVQYIPEVTVQEVQQHTKQLNKAQHENMRLCFYTQGYCCSVASKPQLPAQWIQCDVRKFDFEILGKFSAVIADPAWNIHMNLPYGTCNDSELFQLPFDLLQEEGIIFLWVTGRAIEVGKESLQKWGYTVCNEISWIKTNQLGRTIVTGRTGHWLNHSKEHLLVGLKGNPVWLNRQVDIDLIISATRETSRKPDELYGMIERIVGPNARKLEIFGRDHNTRPGWLTIGNQLEGNCIYELDVKRKYQRSKAGNQKAHEQPRFINLKNRKSSQLY